MAPVPAFGIGCRGSAAPRRQSDRPVRGEHMDCAGRRLQFICRSPRIPRSPKPPIRSHPRGHMRPWQPFPDRPRRMRPRSQQRRDHFAVVEPTSTGDGRMDRESGRFRVVLGGAAGGLAVGRRRVDQIQYGVFGADRFPFVPHRFMFRDGFCRQGPACRFANSPYDEVRLSGGFVTRFGLFLCATVSPRPRCSIFSLARTPRLGRPTTNMPSPPGSTPAAGIRWPSRNFRSS